MKMPKQGSKAGMTLIELIMYVALLSFLLGGFISYAYPLHEENIRLMRQSIDAN